MTHEEIEEKRKTEEEIRSLFNHQNQVCAKKQSLGVGNHEFDLYDADKVIGGITTSPWKCKTGSNNTGGQDRASTELLWLSLWEGKERRVIILSDREMADRLLKRWQGCSFPRQIEIIHYAKSTKRLKPIGELKRGAASLIKLFPPLL